MGLVAEFQKRASKHYADSAMIRLIHELDKVEKLGSMTKDDETRIRSVKKQFELVDKIYGYLTPKIVTINIFAKKEQKMLKNQLINVKKRTNEVNGEINRLTKKNQKIKDTDRILSLIHI